MNDRPKEENCSSDEDGEFDEEQVLECYRLIFEDLKIDEEESEAVSAMFKENPPPMNKLVWIRAAAFRVASELLSEDDNNQNVSLLRCINFIVHTIETKLFRYAFNKHNNNNNDTRFFHSLLTFI